MSLLVIGDYLRKGDADDTPFSDYFGNYLRKFLTKREVSAEFVNVFNERASCLSSFFLKGTHLKLKHIHYIDALKARLAAHKAILCCGTTALWATTGRQGIEQWRGYLYPKDEAVVIGTYHPSDLMKMPQNRVLFYSDLDKIIGVYRDGYKPFEFNLIINPTFSEAMGFLSQLRGDEKLAFDIESNIETNEITHISFAQGAESISINFSKLNQLDRSQVFRLIKEVLESDTPKLTQNGAFDIYLLERVLGIKVNGFIYDTLIQVSCVFPEQKKNLRVLGSQFAPYNFPNWKNQCRE